MQSSRFSFNEIQNVVITNTFTTNDSGSFQGAGGIGGLLAVSVDGQYYFPFYDQIGNVLGYADETGAVAATYDYDVFGNICSATGPLAAFFRHRFSTKLFDPDIGLCYYGYRWYFPGPWPHQSR